MEYIPAVCVQVMGSKLADQRVRLVGTLTFLQDTIEQYRACVDARNFEEAENHARRARGIVWDLDDGAVLLPCETPLVDVSYGSAAIKDPLRGLWVQHGVGDLLKFEPEAVVSRVGVGAPTTVRVDIQRAMAATVTCGWNPLLKQDVSVHCTLTDGTPIDTAMAQAHADLIWPAVLISITVCDATLEDFFVNVFVRTEFVTRIPVLVSELSPLSSTCVFNWFEIPEEF